MKTFITLAILFLAFPSAHALDFKLPCHDVHTGKDISVSVVKVAYKTSAGKWDYRLAVEGNGQRLALVSAQSGDEDYNEFNLPGGEGLNISAAYVQNNFKWATLINMEGSSFAKCEK